MQPFPNLTIYSPPSFETWDYSNPDTQGIGGSETCHIELAKRFAQRGYNVISYGPTPYTTPKTEHNVVWDNYKNIDYTREGIWILIRDCSIVDNIPPLNNRIWLICQDEDYSKENAPTWNWVWNEERRNKLEKIIALCPSHLENLQYAYPDSQEKIVLGSNGIKMDLIREVEKENIQRNKNKIIYFSSPLRGLIPTLKIFKKVREYFPETELTIAYGWDNVNKILDEFPIAKVKKQQIEVLLNQPNITFTGRLPQKALYKEIASSSLFLYPTNFFETGCISSMEAQALGAIPIVSNLGALTNNVQFGEIIDGDIREGLVLGRFVKGIIEWLSQEPLQDILRPPMRTYAQYVFNWERIIDKYESWIHNYGDGHTIIAHSIFQLAHSRGNILNIGCNIDAAGFSNLGATNVDVREYDPVLKRANKVDVLADARNLPSSLFAQFDTTILGEILEHFTEERDVLKTLEEAKKTLKPSGRIIITVPEDYRDPEVQHYKHVKGEDYAEDSKSYHWQPVTKELLYSWLEKTSLKVEHYRQLDYDYFLGHGVVVGK